MESVIYLFISAHKNYHKREFLNIVCFPEKAQIVIAYANKWIPESLRDTLKLKGRDALVSFCELRKDESPRTKLHPSRWVKIVECVQESSGFCFTLELGKFQNYDKSEADIAKLLESFQNKMALINRHPGSIQTENPFYVLESSLWDGRESSENWIALTQHLRGRFALDQCSFFRIAAPKGGTKLFPVKRIAVGQRWTFEIPAASSHPIALEVVLGAAQKQLSTPKIEISSSVGQVLGPIVKQFSEGLVCHYLVDFSPQLQKQSSIIRMHADMTDELRSPSFDAFISVRPRRWVLCVILLCVSLAPILSTMADIEIAGVHFSAKIFAWLLLFLAFLLAFRRFKIV